MTTKNIIPVFTTAGIFVLLLSIDLWELFRTYFYKEERKVELEDIEGLPDFPTCLDSKQLDHYIKEEEMIREKFGYRKMFEDTLETFRKTRAISETIPY